jgi:hypothetical protein
VSDNYWTDRAQNKRISGLEDDLSHVSASLSRARASTDRLKSELSKVRGSLEQRLDRLSAAFDAFVEISDLRVTLGLFDAHGRVRHQAKQLLAGSAPEEVTDADGYWLAPALVALRGVSDGAVDADALSLAVARDPLRARTFHVLLAAVSGGPLPSAAEVFPELPSPVPMYQRAVWLLAADGFFGAEGWDLARSRCTEFVSGLTGDTLSDGLRAVLPQVVVPVPKELDGGGELATAWQACERLAELRSWVTTALDGYTGEPGAAVDPLVRRTLDLLIDEGSPVELPLLARERELRAVIEGTTTASSTWDSPVGTAEELLRADLSEEHPDRRALVLRACAPLVVSMAERFATAARVEPPESLPVRTRYGQVTIRTTGAEPSSLEKAVTAADRSSQVESHRRAVAAGGAVGAVVFVVLAVVSGWGWVFMAVIGAGIGLFQWLTDGRERRAAAEQAVRAKQSLRDDVANRVEVFAKARRKLVDRQPAVTEDLTALREALATVTT